MELLRSLLAECLVQQEHFEEAETVLLSSYENIAPGYSAQGLLFVDPSAPPYPYGYWGRGNYGPWDLYLHFPPVAVINANLALGLSGAPVLDIVRRDGTGGSRHLLAQWNVGGGCRC